MLEITSLKKGIVIDHIHAGLGHKIFQMLKLDDQKVEVALIINAQSKKYGRKDIIKIENELDLNLDIIGLLDPHITVNIIEDGKISRKIHLSLPQHVSGPIKCSNPVCISVTERDVPGKFTLINADEAIYRCDYCDHFYNFE